MWVRRFISIIILVIAIVGALIAAGLAPYALAAWTAHIRLLAAGSVVTFGLIVLLGAWGSAAVWRTTNTRRVVEPTFSIGSCRSPCAEYRAAAPPSATPDKSRYRKLGNPLLWQVRHRALTIREGGFPACLAEPSELSQVASFSVPCPVRALLRSWHRLEPLPDPNQENGHTFSPVMMPRPEIG